MEKCKSNRLKCNSNRFKCNSNRFKSNSNVLLCLHDVIVIERKQINSNRVHCNVIDPRPGQNCVCHVNTVSGANTVLVVSTLC